MDRDEECKNIFEDVHMNRDIAPFKKKDFILSWHGVI